MDQDDSWKTDLGRARKLLAGVTVTVVEDSRSASHAIQLLTTALGGRVRKAQTVEDARRHIASYRPNIMIVDLGLPDGSGLSLLREVSSAPPPVPGLIATSGADPDEWVDAARAAGAGSVLVKPIGGIDDFALTVLSVLPDAMRRQRARLPEQPALQDGSADAAQDLEQLRNTLFAALGAEDEAQIDYCRQFLASLATQTSDSDLKTALQPLEAAARLEEKLSAGARLVVFLSKRLGAENLQDPSQRDSRRALG